MKKCTNCGEMKPTDSYSRRIFSSGNVGLYSYCRECVKEKYKKYYLKNRKFVIKKSKERHTGIDKVKYAARQKLHYEVSAGRIMKENCEICGSSSSEAHHVDYSKPLNVVWLCRLHHAREHMKLC